MRVLLDASVFVTVTLTGLERLSSRKARRVLESLDSQLELSALSLTEIAIKNAVSKSNFPAEMAIEAARDLKVNFIPYAAQHAYAFSRVPRLHADPFDRMNIATAMSRAFQ